MPLLAAVSNLDMPGSGALHGILYADDFPGADWGAKVQAAHDAAPSIGAVIDARGLVGTQSAAATLNLSKAVKIIVGTATVTFAGSPGINITGNAHIEGCGEEDSIFAAGANAVLIAVAAGPVTINDLSMAGNYATWATASGIHITAGHSQNFSRLRMTDWGGVPFTVDIPYGHFMMLVDSLAQPNALSTNPAIVVNGDDPALSPAHRHFSNVDTGGGIIDLQGAQTTLLSNCTFLNLTMNANCKKLMMVNCRLTTVGGSVTLYGINHSIVGNVVAGAWILDASVAGSVIGPNVGVGAITDSTASSSANVIIDHNSYARFPQLSVGDPPPTNVGLFVSKPNLVSVSQYGIQIAFTTTSAATTEGIGLVVRGPNTPAAAFTQNANIGIYIQNTSLGAGSSVGTGYGLFIENITVGATNYAIYSQHTGPSLLSGTLQVAGMGVGAPPQSDAGIFVENSALVGSSQFGVQCIPVATSAATVIGIGVLARCDTAAASFTQTSNACFYAQNPTVGAASAITTLYGVYIENMTGGATNYGLYSAHTGASVFSGALRVAGLQVNGAAGLPAATTANLYAAGGFGSPSVGRIYIGDGTGWQLQFAKRTSSTDTVMAFLNDHGELAVLGSASIAGSLTIDSGYCLRVDTLTGKESAYFTGKVRIDPQLALNIAPDSTSNRRLYCNGDAYIVGNVLTGGNVTIDDAKKLQWSDTNLYRSAAATLKTDTAFVCLSLTISGGGFLDVPSLKVGGTAVIDSSRNATFVSLTIGAVLVIDSSQNGTLASLVLTATPLAVASGGTGASTTAAALSNLGGATAASISGTTLTLAKITGGGSNGSLTLSAQGVVTAYSAPT